MYDIYHENSHLARVNPGHEHAEDENEEADHPGDSEEHSDVLKVVFLPYVLKGVAEELLLEIQFRKNISTTFFMGNFLLNIFLEIQQ